jgi:hypothetical protein
MSDTSAMYAFTEDKERERALRVRESKEARERGEHYWLAATLHRVKNRDTTTADPIILDQENYRGLIIECALCGGDDSTAPCNPST